MRDCDLAVSDFLWVGSDHQNPGCSIQICLVYRITYGLLDTLTQLLIQLQFIGSRKLISYLFIIIPDRICKVKLKFRRRNLSRVHLVNRQDYRERLVPHPDQTIMRLPMDQSRSGNYRIPGTLPGLIPISPWLSCLLLWGSARAGCFHLHW